jgi:hypothetical protein
MNSFRLLAVGVAMALAASSVGAQVDCHRPLEPSDQAMPAEYAICAPQALPFANQPLAPTDTAFVNNLFAGGSSPPPIGIHSHVLNNFPASLTFRGATNPSLFSLDFSPDGSILWGAVASNAATPPANNRTLGQINQTTGAYTVVANLTGFADQAAENASALAINPSTGEAFLFTNAGTTLGNITTRTYRVNLSTGALTLVGAATAQPSFLIDAAINCQGEIFGHQFGGGTNPSNLVRINASTGAITTVGPTGFIANFAQGMDFDADTGTLYMYHFQATSAADAQLRYGTVNLSTGALTPIFSTAAGAGIELEGAVRSSCPIPNAPPIFGYAPPPGSNVTATGGTTIGSTGNLTITPSIATAGSGSGAAATTTLTCTAPTTPFAGFGQTVTAVGSGPITGGPLAGTCTLGATAVTQTLTCTENQGGTSVTRTWTLTCPAGTVPDVPPVFGYTPPPGSTVTATGGSGIIGTTSNLSIAVAVATPGTGTGAPATTTLTCTAPTAPFAGFGQTVTAVGSGAISGGPLAGTCTRGATAVTQTLTCTENQGGENVTRTWTLNCPAGSPPPVAVNATSVWSLVLLMLGLLAVGTVAVRRQF